MTAIRQRLVRGGLWVALVRCSGIVLTLAANMLLARMLDRPSDYGLYLVVITALQLFSIVARGGLDRVLVRFIAENEAHGNASGTLATLTASVRLGGLTLGAAMLGCGLFMVFFGPSYLQLPDSFSNALLMVLGLAAITLSQLAAEVLRGFHNLRLASVFDGLTGNVLAYGLLIIFLALQHFLGGQPLSFDTALALYVTAIVLPVPAALFAAWRAFTNRPSATVEFESEPPEPVTLERVARIGAPIMAAQLAAFVVSRADIFFASYYLAPGALALYAASKRLMQIVVAPLRFVNLTIISTIPELHAQRRMPELQQVLRTSATLASLAALVVLVPLLIAPGATMELIFSAPYRQAAPVVAILAFGQIIFALTGTCGLSLMMTGHHQAVLIVNVFVAISLLAMAPTAAAHFGMIGLAYVASLHNAGRNIILLLLARRLLGVWTHADPKKLGTLASLGKKVLSAR